MTDGLNISQRLGEWAANNPNVDGMVLIGSRARPEGDGIWRADEHSDWDFELLVWSTKEFETDDWLRRLGIVPEVYVCAATKIGRAPKVRMIVTGTVIELVLLPAGLLRLARCLVGFGLLAVSKRLRGALGELALILRPGWVMVKGGPKWGVFFRRIVDGLAAPRLDDRAIRKIADEFVVDYQVALQRTRRGEIIAGRRMMHLVLVEAVLTLHHERRLRRGERSFPEGRRLEKLEPEGVAKRLVQLPSSSITALEGSIVVVGREFDAVVKELAGGGWTWPLKENAHSDRKKSPDPE